MENAPWPPPPASGPASPSQPSRGGIKWKFVLLVGLCGAVLVIGALVALNSVEKGIDLAGTFGVPKDFPVYPNATLVSVHENITPGQTTVNASWEASAPLDTVTAFYSEQLDWGSWQITKKNAVDGTWEFRHTDGKVRGLIRLSGHGQQTRIDVSLLK